MRMYQLAWQNVKNGIRNYLSLILSLAFTIMIVFNFQNSVYSDAFSTFSTQSKDYSDVMIQTMSVVVGFFSIFFIGYATNVFLTRRKKEIGIYIFMGLTNQRIGKLYMLEMTIIGIVTWIMGMGFGILMTQLFQMILLAMSEITVEIGFHISYQPIVITSVAYWAIYMFFIVKGYRNIVRSSVMNLISASKQNEYVRQSSRILLVKTVLGVGILSSGYYIAIIKGGQEVLKNVLLAVILVIVGVYLLFGGLIPFIFQKLAKHKTFLYQKERVLWVNQLVFRMKKNYRTYALVCVLMLCSVTALATSFALKERYEKMVHFRNTYTYQLLSDQPNLDDLAKQSIEQENDLAYSTKISILSIPPESAQISSEQNQLSSKTWMLLDWSQLKQAAEDTGLVLEAEEPEDGEVIKLTHLYLLSLLTKREDVSIEIRDRKFRQLQETNIPFLGYLQESMSFYIVNHTEYEKMCSLGQELYTYNYRIKDIYNYEASIDALGKLTSNTKENYTARIVTGPDSSSDMEWIKILYSLCVFVFMVFIVASVSILFMKLYNDAFEEKERYDILQKIGCSYATLKRAAAKELFALFALPFAVMSISSYFSVHALENMMYTSLFEIRFISLVIIFVFFLSCYWMSVGIYLKNAGIHKT